uniref:Protein SYS1 homolog n=1 Tax=Paramoeba aestuarina TaxID=180227 RepID=A0A7S4NKH3_9EUKA|mmetsp:Transcript_17598/g.27538  ORF Transcript_17598/g.27538 Transcript_17598/m.27538 type:complete len:163 (+) Transcript_17598:145-633(+)
MVSRTSRMPNTFGSRALPFDAPLRIFQIVTLQASFWFTWGAVAWGFSGLFGEVMNLDHLFDPECVSLTSPLFSFSSFFALLFTSVLSTFMISIIVERTTQCPDFCATTLVLHLFACGFYCEFPWRMSWWILMFISMVIMTGMASFLCYQKETQEISVNRRSP